MSLFLALGLSSKTSQTALGQPRAGRDIKQAGLWSQVVFLVGGTLGNRLAAPEEHSLSVGQPEIRDNLQVHHSLRCQGHHARKHPGKPGEPMSIENGPQLPRGAQHSVSRAQGGTCPTHMSLCHLVPVSYSHGPMPESILAAPERQSSALKPATSQCGGIKAVPRTSQTSCEAGLFFCYEVI